MLIFIAAKVQFVAFIIKTAKDHCEVVVMFQESVDGVGGYLCGFVLWKVINARADRRESDGMAMMLIGKLQGVAIGICQQLFFIVFSAVPYGTYCMDHIFCG